MGVVDGGSALETTEVRHPDSVRMRRSGTQHYHLLWATLSSPLT